MLYFDFNRISIMKTSIACICFVLSCLFPLLSSAQLLFKDDNQLWIDGNFQFKLNESNVALFDGGYRSSASESSWYSYYFRPRYRYYFGYRSSITGSAALFITQDPLIETTNEIRLGQQFNYNWPSFSWMQVLQYVRLEERFFYYKDDLNELENSWSFRGRYKLRLESNNFEILKYNHAFYTFISGEVFIPIDGQATERFVNDVRVTAGLGHVLSSNFKIELKYIRQSSKVYNSDGSRSNENIIRWKLFFNFWTKKSILQDD